jgi:WD40 repeat protein
MSMSALIRRHRRSTPSTAFNRNLNGSKFLPASMAPAMTLRGHKGCINTCSFNPYGELELTGCDDGCVWLWDIGGRLATPRVMLRPHLTNVFTTNFLTSTRFLSGGNDATVQVVEITNDGRARATCYRHHHIRKVHSSFVVDESTFVTCSHDSTVRLFDVRIPYRNQELITLDLLTPADLEYAGHARLSRDLHINGLLPQNMGGGLVRAPAPGQVDDGSLLLDFCNEPDGELFRMDVHPIDRKRFLTCGQDGTVRLFDMRAIRRRTQSRTGFSVNLHYRGVTGVTGAAFDMTGDRIAATVIEGSIHVLDAHQAVDLATISGMERPQPQRQGPRPPPPPVMGELQELTGHTSVQTIKTVNWFGNFVVSGSDEGTIYFFDPEDGTIVNILSGHERPVNVVTVHQEKRLLATSGVDDFSILWEPQRVANTNMAKVSKAVDDVQADVRRREPFEALECAIM